MQQVHHPIVLMHGLLDSSKGLKRLEDSLKARFPGVYTKNIVFGENSRKERENSAFITCEKQCEEIWKSIITDEEICKAGKVDFVGHSQGSMLLRYILEEYVANQDKIKVDTFVSLSGPINGVFYKVYKCPAFNKAMSEFIDKFNYKDAFNDEWQTAVAPLNYFKSPYDFQREDFLKSKSIMLKLDNEAECVYNENRKKGFTELRKLVCVWSDIDEMIVPNVSSKFGFYAKNSDEEIIPMEKQSFYINDTFGLKTLNERGDLIILNSHLKHLDYVYDDKGIEFLEKQIWPILDKSGKKETDEIEELNCGEKSKSDIMQSMENCESVKV